MLLASAFLLLVSCALLWGCKPNSSTATETVKVDEFSDVTLVDTAMVTIRPFIQELSTNGSLRAKRNHQIISMVGGMVKELRVIPGQLIQKGDTIALLRNPQLNRDLEDKNLRLYQTRIELEDFLLRYSYNISDSALVPPKIWQNACSRTGYDKALVDYQVARENINYLAVTALFSGLVANISIEPGQQISQGTVLCNALYTNTLICEFNLIEDDYHSVTIDQTISISPFALSQEVTGRVFAKNPDIGTGGVFTVFAYVDNTDNKLVNGMQVKVNLNVVGSKALTIPKEAIVIRNDERIVFTYNNNRVVWNFVEVARENSRYAVITKGLSPGDMVITSNNLFLNENSPVAIRN
jgi:membrane fusion protein (multidrug efflux system)